MPDGPISKRPPVFNVEEINASKDVPWFLKSISPRLMSPALVDLLEKYAGVPPDEQDKHLHEVRDLAWDIFPMPCIGLWWWLVLGMSTHPGYAEVLEFLKSHSPSSPRAFLDLGTCVGQDVRKLIHDGVPLECVYGSDLLGGYEAVGHALFHDKEKMEGHFIKGDIFNDSPHSALVKTRGTWDIVNINMFLHGFAWDEQVSACKYILKLLKPQPGSVVMGIQSGSTKSGVVKLGPPFLSAGVERDVFLHDTESFEKMWEEIAESEGLKLKTFVGYQPRLELGNPADQAAHTKRAGFFPKTEGEQRRIHFAIELESRHPHSD